MTTKIEINESNKYCTTDIAKWIRQTLKETYNDIKFSVKTSLYAGGSSISVTIVENNRLRIIREPREVTHQEILSIKLRLKQKIPCQRSLINLDIKNPSIVRLGNMRWA